MSVFFAQPFVSAHFGAFVPPQSTSVSSWFFTPSSGVGVLHTPPTHATLKQSVDSLHFRPFSHFGAVEPPQRRGRGLRPPATAPSRAGAIHA